MLYKNYALNDNVSTEIKKIREGVRAIAFNNIGECAYIHIKGEDAFGYRNHFESAGGGIEPGETKEATLRREVLEELGYNCEVKSYLGLAINYFQPIKMLALNHYFVVKVNDFKGNNLTNFESTLFEGIEWRAPDVWLKTFLEPSDGINAVLHKREYDFLSYYLTLLDK